MASYARQAERFAEANLQLVAISVDTPEQNAAMVEKLLLPFPILSDPEGEVIKAYDVWNPHEGGIALPSLFLIRPDRSVAWSYTGEDYADRPTDDELFKGAASGAEG